MKKKKKKAIAALQQILDSSMGRSFVEAQIPEEFKNKTARELFKLGLVWRVEAPEGSNASFGLGFCGKKGLEEVVKEAFVPNSEIQANLKALASSDGDPTAEDAPEVNQAQSFEDFSSAPNLLQIGVDAMRNRAASRDNDGERSMAKTVAAFNALSGERISEEDGWLFMVCLKLARSMNGSKKIADDYADGAAYLALQGECALRQQHAQKEANAFLEIIKEQKPIVEAAQRAEVHSRPEGRQTAFSAGQRVEFRLLHEAEHQTGTVYGEPHSLAIRPDKRPMHPIDINSPLDLRLATSSQD